MLGFLPSSIKWFRRLVALVHVIFSIYHTATVCYTSIISLMNADSCRYAGPTASGHLLLYTAWTTKGGRFRNLDVERLWSCTRGTYIGSIFTIHPWWSMSKPFYPLIPLPNRFLRFLLHTWGWNPRNTKKWHLFFYITCGLEPQCVQLVLG